MIESPVIAAMSRRCIGPVLLALVSATVPVGAAGDHARRIVDERARVQARFSERERQCGLQFVVTACVDEARRERRAALDLLRADEIRLDEARRRERAAARRTEIDAKTAETALPSDGLLHAPSRPGSESADVRQAREVENRAAFEARQQRAASHREVAEARRGKRSSEGKKPAPGLPVPSFPFAAASAPPLAGGR